MKVRELESVSECEHERMTVRERMREPLMNINIELTQHTIVFVQCHTVQLPSTLSTKTVQ